MVDRQQEGVWHWGRSAETGPHSHTRARRQIAPSYRIAIDSDSRASETLTHDPRSGASGQCVPEQSSGTRNMRDETMTTRQMDVIEGGMFSRRRALQTAAGGFGYLA